MRTININQIKNFYSRDVYNVSFLVSKMDLLKIFESEMKQKGINEVPERDVNEFFDSVSDYIDDLYCEVVRVAEHHASELINREEKTV
ncbi:hypothetical protein SAMN04487866_1268 [Thermoactinomyces sp. DSM 45891]|uniref:hypothetical protein n=1 Tax=Thermoactinomyces sp. DSM 45891 TaxID=1761907 RepID=UPI000915B59F|nr:hypothetical protein [Thermoactinomyces sp. DSM 45891]SFX79193.1 hypothetical protein SAMN04487866_1268 [Thermoactinomyces sp. DSM 45891]